MFSEAWRNIRSGSSHVLLFGAALFLLLGGLAASEVAAVGALVNQATAYRQAGATVTTFVSNGAIDGAACQALHAISGVRATGAIRSSTTQPLPLGTLPAGPIPTFEATPGFSRILLADDKVARTTGVWIPAALADTLAARSGTVLFTAAGRKMTIAAVYPFPSDGRSTDLQNAIIEPAPAPGAFDQCWVETWPYNPDIVALARMTLIADPPAGTTITTGTLNPTLGSNFNGATMLRDRATAPAWIAALFIGLAIGAVSIATRRRHLAEARHAGVHLPAQLLQTILETAAVPATALPVATIACAVLSPATDTISTWLLGIRILGIGAAATLLGAAIVTTSIRQRALPYYLKD